MSSKDAISWIQNNLETYFKPGVYKDISEKAPVRPKVEPKTNPDEVFEALKLVKGKTQAATSSSIGEKRIKIAGFGGQGALTAGVVIATAGMNEGLDVSWLPSYGPEMRGGTANCSVIISGKRIGSPVVINPNILVAMNGPSLDSFENDVVPGGVIIVNSSIVERKVKRTDVKAIHVPLTEIAAGLGLRAAANMVGLGVLLGHEKMFNKERIHEVFKTSLKRKETLEINIKAVNAGFDFVQNL